MGEIDDYLAGLEGSQRVTLERVRDIAQRVAPEASQGKSYGMLALRVDAPRADQWPTHHAERSRVVRAGAAGGAGHGSHLQ